MMTKQHSVTHGSITGVEPKAILPSTMPSLATLPYDVLDRILTFLADFSTLRSAIFTCNAMYAAYKARPESIRMAVAHNLGPTCALSTLR